jgi:hypothetical protein
LSEICCSNRSVTVSGKHKTWLGSVRTVQKIADRLNGSKIIASS